MNRKLQCTCKVILHHFQLLKSQTGSLRRLTANNLKSVVLAGSPTSTAKRSAVMIPSAAPAAKCVEELKLLLRVKFTLNSTDMQPAVESCCCHLCKIVRLQLGDQLAKLQHLGRITS